MNFNTIGIICEYNPFHFGHLYHINETKKSTGCRNLICIMSGSVVQRGDIALFDKWTRAKAAIDNGADLVIELPAYYVLQSAEIFAMGAVKILDSLGVVDAISFGSESSDISLLEKAGKFLANPDTEYSELLNDRLKSGEGYPKASEYALRNCLDINDEDFFSPNNILAMCYIRAAYKIGSDMRFVTVGRHNDYHGLDSSDGYLSATAIRKMIEKGEDYRLYAPDYNFDLKYRLKNAEAYVLGFLRNIPTEMLSLVRGHESGLANLIKNSACKACCLDELFELCVNRRYTLHRIRRFIMCALLGINESLEFDYVRVLGFNTAGASLLKQIKENTNLNIITKTADYPGSKMFDIDVAATDLAALCCDDITKRICGADFITSPYIQKK